MDSLKTKTYHNTPHPQTDIRYATLYLKSNYYDWIAKYIGYYRA